MYLVRKDLPDGLTEICAPGDGDLEYISLAVFRTDGSGSLAEKTGENEVALVVLSGTVDIKADDIEMKNIGSRPDVFSGKASAVFVPRNSSFEIKGTGLPAETAVCRVAAAGDGDVRLILPDDVKVKTVGAHNWRRQVHDIIDLRTPASRIVLGETFNPPGNWSSFPPHRHDEDRLPLEVNMEEVYHFRLKPSQGFGFQRIYTDDRSMDEVFVLQDCDTTIMPRGYHPVAAAPGYQLYYLWILAGTGRVLQPFDDPEHAWIKGAENIIKCL
ncbi:MAG: 5-deoxy-glucuronate isomerase [Planctomycetes bacterium]|nr:5-deoxy-glucuronate isomerase [Planctomycetota bacterium]